MATIGNIPVPSIPSSGLTFPLTTEFGYGQSQGSPVIVHRFGDLDAKCEQRYKVGFGPIKHTFQRAFLTMVERNALATFWENIQGPSKSFIYNVPNADGRTFTPTTVVWDSTPLSFDYLVGSAKTGITFIEVPTSPITYTVTGDPLTRFPNDTLETAFTSTVQEVIPLIHIKVCLLYTSPSPRD